MDTFEWGAVGDSWTSGVAYSSATVYKKTDFEFCYRTNEAWGAQMEADKTWTKGTQDFHFAGCGGTLMDDIPRQMGKTGNSRLILGTIGGNNGFFGDIARACIYQPAPGSWGPPYDEDPKGEGEGKKNLKKSRDYIMATENGLRDQFKETIDNIFIFKQSNGQMQPRFDLYVSSYVEFFDATSDDCDKWTFSRWFSSGYPKLVKALRAEMNELVKMFNDVQADVISKYKGPSAYSYYAHYIPVSDQFTGHRFCEKKHSFDDQWTSSDVWIWNLQWNNGDTDTGGTKQPPDAPNPPLPVLSLDTRSRTYLDYQLFMNGTDVNVLQSGFGWTARPFHPKPKGHEQMKNFFIQTLKKDRVPGIAGAMSIPTITSIAGATSIPTITSIAGPTSILTTKSITSSTPTPCSGNQVQESCVAGTLPSATPYSGIQPPSCAKADGSPGSDPRINKGKASQAAADYCQSLIKDNVVLTAKSTNTRPYIQEGGAENKKAILLIVLYDVVACPTDKSKSTLDFKVLGQDACVKNFVDYISQICAQDSTWTAFNPDFTLQGGVIRNDCAIWSLGAQ